MLAGKFVRSKYFEMVTKAMPSGSTRLGEEPIPPLSEIASDPQFEPIEITKEEFEEIWNNRKKR